MSDCGIFAFCLGKKHLCDNRKIKDKIERIKYIHNKKEKLPL